MSRSIAVRLAYGMTRRRRNEVWLQMNDLHERMLLSGSGSRDDATWDRLYAEVKTLDARLKALSGCLPAPPTFAPTESSPDDWYPLACWDRP